jgi:hypothetical protein
LGGIGREKDSGEVMEVVEQGEGMERSEKGQGEGRDTLSESGWRRGLRVERSGQVVVVVVVVEEEEEEEEIGGCRHVKFIN